MKFRNLRADEIDVRVAQVKANGCMLLLYKDARCDMNILDEVVGTMNWQRSHTRNNANCIVSIWDSEKSQWISKEDTGTESNTEKAKGQASDSFKRACFNWGIGRELYTAPFIWVDAKNVNINGGKTYDKFQVDAINVEKGIITGLIIYNKSKKCVAFKMGKSQNNVPTPPIPAPQIYHCKNCNCELVELKNGNTILPVEKLIEQTGGLCLTCFKKQKTENKPENAK